MPVTIKLSQKLYEKLGEDVANELVDWFNRVDATYRGDLREINELNFARFDAKLEHRIADVRAEIRAGLAALKGEMTAEMGKLRGELTAEIAQGLASLETKLVRWMVGLWATALLAMIGLSLRR